ncbi:RDD family protein [Agaribacter marinus]|uniref:RDD domain-containing protein n=1 Tax=Agaribacter marinus TaxID=1431249 RepID=A0AA37SX24_9ALTE|nr:RDD family protein [Agaribacter marinus]GLR71202.1 hypothetical protein GCM10007852_21100 [Agaribacter marinus]
MSESIKPRNPQSDNLEVDQQSASLNKKDRKDIITPYAFGVSAGLYGTPLASPSRRVIAIGFDLVIISAISGVSGHALAILIAVLLLFVSKRFRREDRFRTWQRILVIVASIIVILSALDFYWMDSYAPQNQIKPESASESTLSTESQPSDPTLHDDNKQSEINKQTSDYSIISWVKGIATDLGIGFGWAAVYFTALTTLFKGQTFGKLLLGVKVIKLDGSDLNIWESFGRYGGYGAGIATGLLGFFQIYWDANRQAIQDKISETLVIDKHKPKENYTPNKSS